MSPPIPTKPSAQSRAERSSQAKQGELFEPPSIKPLLAAVLAALAQRGWNVRWQRSNGQPLRYASADRGCAKLWFRGRVVYLSESRARFNEARRFERLDVLTQAPIEFALLADQAEGAL